MKFADNVPYYVRARYQREVAKARRTFSQDIDKEHKKTRFEFRLCGNTVPFVEDPFTPLNILAGKSTPSEENKRRKIDGKMQLVQYAARCTRPFQEIFDGYPEVISQLEQNEGDFDFVLCSAVPLDDSGRTIMLPRILEVRVFADRTLFTFNEETHPEILSSLTVLQTLSSPAIGNYFVSNVVEDFTDMNYIIRMNGDPDQTNVLKEQLTRKLSEGVFSIKKVLVVGDFILAGMLSEIGFKVVVADNNVAAGRLRTDGFDLLITDLVTQFEGPQGFELIRSAKTAQPTIKTLLLSRAANTHLSYPGDVVGGYVEKKSSFLGELLGIIDLLACD